MTSQYTTISDITKDWCEIKTTATEIIDEHNEKNNDLSYNITKVSLAGNDFKYTSTHGNF